MDDKVHETEVRVEVTSNDETQWSIEVSKKQATWIAVIVRVFKFLWNLIRRKKPSSKPDDGNR